jgi:undecaprenyl pyrophosphate phosphatase UppP
MQANPKKKRLLLSDNDIELYSKNDVYKRKKIFMDFVLWLSIIVILLLAVFLGLVLLQSDVLRQELANKLIEASGYIVVAGLALIGFQTSRSNN